MSDVPERNLVGLLTKLGIAAWSAVGILVLIWVAIWITVRADILIAPVVLSVALIYILNPVVSRLHRVRVPRVLGTTLAFLLLTGLVVLLGFMVVPSITEQGSEFASTFPTIYEDTTLELEALAADLGFDVDIWSYDRLQEFINDPDNQDQFFDAIRERLGAVTSSVLEAILVFFLAPVIAFYVLIDLDRIRDESLELIPDRLKDEVVHVSRQLGTAVGGFLRGQVVVALIVGILTSLGFLAIGLPFWLIIGMTAGFLNIIPFLGPWVGGTLGVIVALVTRDLSTAFWAGVVALGVQQIDNNFVSPTVLRATVRLHPAVVILVLLLGGGIGGLWGVLLAVPVAASIKILVGHFWRTRVLGQSLEEAGSALIEDPTTQETLLARMRRINDDEEVGAEVDEFLVRAVERDEGHDSGTPPPG